MDKVVVQEMKEILLKHRQEIINNLVKNNEDFNAIIEEGNPKDFGDIASTDIDRKMLEHMGAKDLKRMQQIDSALMRLEQNKYGVCIKCNKKISIDRLRAIPYALMCIDCQMESEKKRRT